MQPARPVRSLAEIAVWYSIAVIASLFVMLFIFAALSAQSVLSPAVWLPSGAALWLFIFVTATWRLARSPMVQNATVSLGPIYLLQAVLLVFTLARLPFESPTERGMVTGMLLVWETWVVIFSLGFLFLSLCGRRRVPMNTWLSTAGSALLVGFSIYQVL